MAVRIDATIQARMGSGRLPGKVLLPVAGQPLLARIIERIRRSRLIDRVIVATSTAEQDNPIAELAERLDCPCFRGSEQDVLGRVVGALRTFNVDIHVEFQGDNAVPDPLLIDSVIGYYLKCREEYDYVTTALRTTYPPGSEVTVYPASVLALAEAEWESGSGRSREHVGPHIYQRPGRFRCCNLEASAAYHHPDIHLEVDTLEDYQVVCQLYDHFLPEKPDFTLGDAIGYALQSDIWRNNADIPRRWRSYRADGGSD